MGKRRRRIHRKRLSGLITVLLLAVLVFVRGCAEIRQREPDRRETEQSAGDAELTDTAQIESEGYPTVETLSGESLPYTDCLTVEATAYSGGGTTALGTAAEEGTVAVDPDVIPLGVDTMLDSLNRALYNKNKEIGRILNDLRDKGIELEVIE